METYRILALGDFHFGENYPKGAETLAGSGYNHSLIHLRKFVRASDTVIVNLETPLVDPERTPSPLVGKKAAIHWGHPKYATEHLADLGVDAVSLANNHALDHGVKGLESTFQVLSEAGIKWFGAGRNIQEAQEPYVIALPKYVGGGQIQFHGSFQYSNLHDKIFSSFAGPNTPGCAPLSLSSVPPARTEETPVDAFQVAFPHWPPNYKWRKSIQYQIAHRLLQKDYDLILAHGGHSLQEVHRKRGRWVVYGLGNGNFMSAGRWQKYVDENGILPFSLWAILEIRKTQYRRTVHLKLYPVYSDNTKTNFQPGPVGEEEFFHVVSVLENRGIRPWRFKSPARSWGKDELGYFIELDLGEWSTGDQATRLVSGLRHGDPNEWTIRSHTTLIEDTIIDSPRSPEAQILVAAAEAEGAQARWLSRRSALIEHGARKLLVRQSVGHQSVVADMALRDQLLTDQLLAEAKIPRQQAIVVRTVQEAIDVADSLSAPVTVSPARGSWASAALNGLSRADEVRSSYRQAQRNSARVVLREHVPGDTFRVIAASTHVLSVRKLLPPIVEGDGSSTLQQLVDDKNMQREIHPSFRRSLIILDRRSKDHLKALGLSETSVPAYGMTVVLSDQARFSDVADTEAVPLDTVSEPIKHLAMTAISAIPGLELGEVDVVIPDGRPTPIVAAVKSRPDLLSALFPVYGKPGDVERRIWKARYEATADENFPAKDVAAPSRNGSPGNELARELEGSEYTFSRVFMDSLHRHGFSIKKRSSRLFEVSSPEGNVRWATASGRTVQDRSVVERHLQRHELTIRLLKSQGTPTLPLVRLKSVDQAVTFLEESGVDGVSLGPISEAWHGRESRILTSKRIEEISANQGSLWAQPYPRGPRLRVLASRTRAWVITSSESVSDSRELDFDAISSLAVKAVRAVPELRWACVDIVLQPGEAGGEPGIGWAVEGLSLRPMFNQEEYILRGDIDAFCCWIVSDE